MQMISTGWELTEHGLASAPICDNLPEQQHQRLPQESIAIQESLRQRLGTIEDRYNVFKVLAPKRVVPATVQIGLCLQQEEVEYRDNPHMGAVCKRTQLGANRSSLKPRAGQHLRGCVGPHEVNEVAVRAHVSTSRSFDIGTPSELLQRVFKPRPTRPA